MFKKLRQDVHGMVDLGIVITIGIVFAGMSVGAYILWTIYTQLLPSAGKGSATYGYSTTDAAKNRFINQSKNITIGFDNAIALILVAITIFILALALSALLMLRGRE
jgi:hypothetical protein